MVASDKISTIVSCSPLSSPPREAFKDALYASPAVPASVREALEAALAEHDYKRAQQVMLTEPSWVDQARRALALPAPDVASKLTPGDMVLHPLSEIREWDEALKELGIQDSPQTPAEAIRKLNGEIERLRAGFGWLTQEK